MFTSIRSFGFLNNAVRNAPEGADVAGSIPGVDANFLNVY